MILLFLVRCSTLCLEHQCAEKCEELQESVFFPLSLSHSSSNIDAFQDEGKSLRERTELNKNSRLFLLSSLVSRRARPIDRFSSSSSFHLPSSSSPFFLSFLLKNSLFYWSEREAIRQTLNYARSHTMSCSTTTMTSIISLSLRRLEKSRT